MSVAYVQAAVSALGEGVSSRTAALTGVGAGNLIVAVALWEGATTTVAISDGTSSFDLGTAGVNTATIDGSWDIRQCPAYLLNANSGDKTYTLTLGGTRNTVILQVFEFSKTEGDWALDGQATYGQGNGTTMTSGSLSTSGTNIAAVSWGRNWTSGAYTGETIGGSAATEVIDSGTYSGFGAYRLATLSSATAVATCSSQQWLIGLIAFSADVSGPAPRSTSAALILDEIVAAASATTYIPGPTIAVSQVGADILVEWS